LAVYPSLLEIINNDSDKKKLSHPIAKIFSIPTKKLFLHSAEALKKSFFANDFSSSLLTKHAGLFQNAGQKNKTATFFSSSLYMPTTDRNTRKFANLKAAGTSFNLSTALNAPNSHFQFVKQNLVISPAVMQHFVATRWFDLILFNKLASNRLYFDAPSAPLATNTPYSTLLTYDDPKTSLIENSPTALQTKDELIALFVPKIY
jgi:hypothetical protein